MNDDAQYQAVEMVWAALDKVLELTGMTLIECVGAMEAWKHRRISEAMVWEGDEDEA